MNGLSICYSPVNQAYLVLWCGWHVLGIFNEKWEAQAYVDDLQR